MGEAQYSKRTKCSNIHSPRKSTVNKGDTFPCFTIITQLRAAGRAELPSPATPFA